MDCLFCKILRSEIPALKIAETSKCIAFLDINPISKGHTLIVPKEHAKKMHELSDETLLEIMPFTKMVAKKVLLAVNVTDYNVLQNNGKKAHQEIEHVHFHIIPRTEADGLHLGWNALKLNNGELEHLFNQIK